MNFLTKNKQFFIISLLCSIFLSPLLSSCGSSSGDNTTAGIGGTGVTQGKITSFGSIFVNGVEFDTDSSQFEVDGDTNATQASLSIGMVVTIRGDVDNNGTTGTAESVEYDDRIQGPIANTPIEVDGQKTLNIFDKSVIIDQTGTNFDGTDFDNIGKDDIVEISGFSISATAIEATFVKKTGTFGVGEEVELKGTITNLDLMASSFTLAGATITFNSQTEIEVPGGILSDGLFVEVEGSLQSATEIMAEEIEAEDEEFEDGEEISLQGVIADYLSDSDFKINGQPIDAGGAELSPGNLELGDGINVEVEGSIVNGVLIADEVELREGEVEIKSFISIDNTDIANNQFQFTFPSTIGSIIVKTDNQTSFEDEVGNVSNLSQLVTGYFVKIEGIDTGNEIIANQVKRLDPADEDIEVQGIVDSFDEIGPISDITLFGVNFDVNNLTNPGFVVGDIVEIKDFNPADGSIDEIELDD